LPPVWNVIFLRQRVVQVVAVLQAALTAAVDDRHAVDHDQAVGGAAAVHREIHSGFGDGPADVLRHARDEHAGRHGREADEVTIRRQRVHRLARGRLLLHDVLSVDDGAGAGDGYRLFPPSPLSCRR